MTKFAPGDRVNVLTTGHWRIAERFLEPASDGVQPGHPRFYQLTAAENELHVNKNHDYAQGGRPMGNFERVAAILAAYPKLDLKRPAVVALVYLLKQLDAAFWLLNEGHTSKTGEGMAERLRDVSVYAKLATILVEEEGSK